VHMLVRSAGLADTMSRYLIRRIEETPSIILRPCSEIRRPGRRRSPRMRSLAKQRNRAN
jgi:thioredoxin reductase (NADPH)